jgi:hypothetical protein
VNRATILAFIFVLSVLMSGCDDEDGSAPAGSSLSDNGTAATLADISAEDVLATPGPWLVYIHGLDPDSALAGELWIANMDGTLAAPFSPIGGDAVFAGFSGGILYYVSFLEGRGRTLWALDPAGDQLQPLFSFEARNEFDAYAAVSPGARHIAYTNGDSLYLFALDTGESRLLLAGNGAACDGMSIGGCEVYLRSRWSPNGALLLVDKGYYEGSRPFIVDPFAAQTTEVETVASASVWGRAWSPDSASFCGTDSYGGTGLYVGSAPSWDARDLLPEYALPSGPPARARTANQACDWVDPRIIAFATIVSRFDDPAQRSAPTIFSLEVSVHRLSPTSTETVATIEDGGFLAAPSLLVLPDSRLLLGYLRGTEVTGLSPSRPEIIDLTTGEREPILNEGDWVVAVIR